MGEQSPLIEQENRALQGAALCNTAAACVEPAPLATTTVMLELVTSDRTAASRVWLYAPAGMPRLSVTTAGFTAFWATQSKPAHGFPEFRIRLELRLGLGG